MSNRINILLLGETGVGKSSLGNQILEEPNVFSISDRPESETKKTLGHMGKNNKNIFVIDTPGFQDSEGKDKEHLTQMINYIKAQNLLQAILLVFNYCENKESNILNKSNKTILEIIKNIFNNIDIGGHIGIFFTHYYPNETDEDEKESSEKNDFVEEGDDVDGEGKNPIGEEFNHEEEFSAEQGNDQGRILEEDTNIIYCTFDTPIIKGKYEVHIDENMTMSLYEANED